MKKILNFIYFLYLVSRLKKSRRPVKKGTLLLIKLDSIGDYILFRNFIPLLINKYKGYKITWCGNIETKELVSSFDGNLFYDMIWIDRNKFLNDSGYKKSVLQDIYNRAFEVVISPAYTREILFADQLVHASCADVRIGSMPSPDKSGRMNLLTNRFYTRLIETPRENLFEFYRVKSFFEKLTGDTSINRPAISPLPDTMDYGIKDHILLFPGAKEPKRRWRAESFAETANYIIENSHYNIAIAGSNADMPISENIIKATKQKERVIDLAGKSSITGLVKLISECTLLITNETGAMHIAAALNVPFICISNGNHYGRFNPYPKELFSKSVFIYPPDFDKDDKEALRYNSELDINSIKPESVIEQYKLFERTSFGSQKM